MNLRIKQAIRNHDTWVSDSLKWLGKQELSVAQSAIFHSNRAANFLGKKAYDKSLQILDSLLNNDEPTSPAMPRVQLIFMKGRVLNYSGKPNGAKRVFKHAIAVAQENGYFLIKGKSYYNLGRIYEDQGVYDSSITCYENAEEPLLKSNSHYLGPLYKSIGIVYRKLGLNSEAIAQYAKALNYYSEKKDTSGQASVCNSMGIIAIIDHRYSKAQDYFEQALFFDKLCEPKERITLNIYNNLGILYTKKGVYDSASYFLKEAIHLAKAEGNKLELGKEYANLGFASKKSGEFDASKKYYFHSIGLKKELQTGSNSLVQAYAGLADLYTQTDALDSAAYYFKKVNSLIRKQNNPSEAITYYEGMLELHRKKGLFKEALLYSDSLNMLKEKVESKEKNELLANYSLLFDSRADKLQNEILKHHVELEQQRNESAEREVAYQQRLFIASIIVIVLVIALLLKVIIDRKKLRTLNDQLQVANTRLNQSLNDNKSLMGVVAHDLKTPFSQLEGLMSLLTDSPNLDEKQQQYIALMSQVVDAGNKLVHNLLLANRAETVEVSKQKIIVKELFDTLDNKFESHLKKKAISFEISCDPGLEISSDKAILSRILENLLSNAVKFSNEHSRVWLQAVKEKNRTVISVADEGPGISEKELPLLFKRYQKLSAKPTKGESSTGLGLYIVRSLCDQLEIGINVESELGKGTTFYLYIY